MRLWVDTEEWFPVYTFSDQPSRLDDEIVVDDQTFQRWVEASRAFHTTQIEIQMARSGAARSADRTQPPSS